MVGKVFMYSNRRVFVMYTILFNSVTIVFCFCVIVRHVTMNALLLNIYTDKQTFYIVFYYFTLCQESYLSLKTAQLAFGLNLYRTIADRIPVGR